jgi:hypothetical protein
MTVIRKVWKKSSTGQKMLTIPPDADIEPGDYVRVERVEKSDADD